MELHPACGAHRKKRRLLPRHQRHGQEQQHRQQGQQHQNTEADADGKTDNNSGSDNNRNNSSTTAATTTTTTGASNTTAAPALQLPRPIGPNNHTDPSATTGMQLLRLGLPPLDDRQAC